MLSPPSPLGPRTYAVSASSIPLGMILSFYCSIPLRIQVRNNHNILAQNLYHHYYYPKPKYQIIGYMDPLSNPRHDSISDIGLRRLQTWAPWAAKEPIQEALWAASIKLLT